MRKAQRTGSRLAGAVVLLCALSLIAAGLLFGGSGRWQTASPDTQLTNQPSAAPGGSNVRSVTPATHPSARSAETSTPAGDSADLERGVIGGRERETGAATTDRPDAPADRSPTHPGGSLRGSDGRGVGIEAGKRLPLLVPARERSLPELNLPSGVRAVAPLLASAAFAAVQDTPAAPEAQPETQPASTPDPINAGDTAWILTSTTLVLLMTIPGLALF